MGLISSINNADFVHLHNHTEYSRFDGLQKMADYVLQARIMGFKSLAISDHGNVGGWIKFFNECKRKKDKKDKELLGADGKPLQTIKPIFGQEFYLCRDFAARGMKEQVDGRKGNRHLLLLAKNWEGYENLCTLSQKAFTDGQAFSDPRIDLNQLAQHSKGLICSSACLGSVVNNNLLHGRYEQAKKVISIFIDIFGKENLYLSVMYHGIDEEGAIIPDIIKLAKLFGLRVVAENDCHYTFKEQSASHELLMAISSSRCINDPKRIHFPYDEFYLKSAAEMAKIFGSHPEILTNTVSVAEQIEDFMKKGGMRLPKFDIERSKMGIKAIADDLAIKYGEEFKNEIEDADVCVGVKKLDTPEHLQKEAYQFLCELADEGMKKLGWDKSQAHIDALKMELGDVQVAWDMNRMDFATYFLIVWQYISFARSKGILTGCGRGSGYASVLLRTLGITYGPDPVKYSLLWVRFLAFDFSHVLLDSDWGFDEPEEAIVSSEVIETSEDEDRPVEEDAGGSDRY